MSALTCCSRVKQEREASGEIVVKKGGEEEDKAVIFKSHDTKKSYVSAKLREMWRRSSSMRLSHQH